MRLNLKIAMQLRGVRVVQLAARVGQQPYQISNFVQGHADPRPELRRRIAEVLDADEAWLFQDVKRVPPFSRSGRKRGHEPSVEIAEAANVAG